MDNKESFLKNLKDQTFCRLYPSKTEGVGVFAIRDIPSGVNPFPCYPHREEKFVNLSEEEFSTLPLSVQNYIRDFFIKDEKGYPVNFSGLNDLNISFYINHSTSPNIQIKDFSENPSDLLNTFLTNKDILEGEELTCDYNTFLGVNNIKEQFPFLSQKNEASVPIHEYQGGEI